MKARDLTAGHMTTVPSLFMTLLANSNSVETCCFSPKKKPERRKLKLYHQAQLLKRILYRMSDKYGRYARLMLKRWRNRPVESHFSELTCSAFLFWQFPSMSNHKMSIYSIYSSITISHQLARTTSWIHVSMHIVKNAAISFNMSLYARNYRLTPPYEERSIADATLSLSQRLPVILFKINARPDFFLCRWRRNMSNIVLLFSVCFTVWETNDAGLIEIPKNSHKLMYG